MKPKAYIETSIVSYLTARQSRDLVLAAHQQVTHDWWARRGAFELFASQFVLTRPRPVTRAPQPVDGPRSWKRQSSKSRRTPSCWPKR